MGQNISKSITPPPLTLDDCLINGKVDLSRYYFYKRRRNEMDDSLDVLVMTMFRKKRKFDDIDDNSSKSSNSSKRSVKKHKLLVRNDDGSLRELTPKDTLWYCLYVQSPPQNERMHLLFRNRFRLSYTMYKDLLEEISNHELFERWTKKDAVGDLPSNLALLLLGSLRYLGRFWTFDDVYEANGISREVNRVFYGKLIEYGSTVMYKKSVIDMAQYMDYTYNDKLFEMAGMNGCKGSSDATHVIMLKCSSWATIGHKGFKLNLPARTYNLTVSHTKQILCTTTGHPSTWNDKTIVLFDPLISTVHDGEMFQDNEFSLYEYDLHGNIIEIKYKGAWYMVDNGYLNWSCTVPPVKDASTYETIRFSEWLESMRKNVECTFGIMKMRFSPLRSGIRLWSIKDCDKTWMTCCALHNMLLFHDGYDQNWNLCEYDAYLNPNNNSNPTSNVSFAVNRLNRHISGNVTNSTVRVDQNKFSKYTENGFRIVSKMPLDVFRDCLIRHFDIRFKSNSVFWPKHLGKKPTCV